MSAPPPTVVPIFATPFAIVTVPSAESLNPALAPLLRERATETQRDLELARDPLCFRSRETLFELKDEAVVGLKHEMLAGLCTAVMAANLYSEAEFDQLGLQVRARFAIIRPDGSIPATTIPMASWVAVYCVLAPPPTPSRQDSGVLRLYATRHGSMFMDAANWRLRAPFGAAHHLWPPVPGQMAVFPASILHEVALNRTDEELLLVLARSRFAHAGQGSMPPW